MGIINVSMSSLIEEPFLPIREIKEIRISGREKPYFQSVKHEPISFSLNLYFKEGFENRELRKVARWLFQDYYKPLYFESNPARIFYCMITGESTLVHNGVGEGYIKVDVRCDSPYTYTPTYNKEGFYFTESGEKELIAHSNYNEVEGTYKNLVVENGSLKPDKTLAQWKSVPFDMKWSDVT